MRVTIRTRVMAALCAATLTGLTTLAPSAPSAQAAIGGLRVTMRMPFDGGGRTGIEAPGVHHHFFTSGWAWDIHKGLGSAVYANFASSDGTVTIRTGTIGNVNNGAGQYVPVTVKVNGTAVGTIWFGHLTALQVASNTDYPAGVRLGSLGSGSFPTASCGDGTADGWPYSASWQVCTPSGVHAHIDVANGCYRPLGLNATIDATTPILMLSSGYAAGNNSACDVGEMDAVNAGVQDSDGDGIPNTGDTCPSLFGHPAWRGCRAQMLRNGSLEEGNFNGWGKLDQAGAVTNIAAYGNASVAREGTWYGAMNVAAAGGSIYQDVGTTPRVGQSFTYSMWVRKEGAGTVSGSLTLWGMGGSQNLGVSESFSVSNTWTLVSVTYDVRLAHTFMRAQMYINTPGQTVLFDGAELSLSLLRNGSFEEGNGLGWGVLSAGTNIAAYGNASVAREGAWYGAMNVAVPKGSVYQDIAQASQAGESYTYSMWVRKESPGTVTGSLALFGLGGAQILGVGESFTVGTKWTLVSVTYDVRLTHTALRAQMYIDTPGQTVLFDGAQVVRNGLRNASFEEGSSIGWGKIQAAGTVTNIAAYGNPAVAREGDWYGAMNVSAANGSIFQDMGIAPRVGESYTFSMWIRKESPGTVSGRLVLWGVGGSQNLSGVESFTVNQDWTQVSVTYDVRLAHSFLRAEMYIDTVGQTVLFDGAVMSPGSNRTSPPPTCQGRVVTVDLVAGLRPTAGDDVILGTVAGDTINGGGGNDIICGSSGNDVISGGTGDDRIDAGSGDDTIDPGIGNDVVIGNIGSDRVSYATASAAVSVNLGLGAATGGSGSDTLSTLEHITGSKFTDTLVGNAIANSILGGAGNDVIAAAAGNDVIDPGSGNDIVNGNDGVDRIVYTSATSGVVLSLATLLVSGGSGADKLASIESALGSNFADTMNGGVGANYLLGGPGNDKLAGGAGNDRLSGGPGSDSCNGSTGTDTADTCESLISVP